MFEKLCFIEKAHINGDNYSIIRELQKECEVESAIDLKLELDYKKNLSMGGTISEEQKNEFLCFFEEELVGYVGIGDYSGKKVAEITGMVKKEFRGIGIFAELMKRVLDECKRRGFLEILLLSDSRSKSGVKFIEKIGGEYSFSEYRMKKDILEKPRKQELICLRKATNDDFEEIISQDTVYFGQEVGDRTLPEREEEWNEYTYITEKDGAVVGKIKITYEDEHAYISGVGVKPKYRGLGYGKGAILGALDKIYEANVTRVYLDVECKNKNALGIYKNAGFIEESVMNYYKMV